MALDHIKVNDCDFIVDCSTKDENNREIDRFQVVKLDKLYKLWNIASNYGHLRTEELKFLSEEEGKVRGFLWNYQNVLINDKTAKISYLLGLAYMIYKL